MGEAILEHRAQRRPSVLANSAPMQFQRCHDGSRAIVGPLVGADVDHFRLAALRGQVRYEVPQVSRICVNIRSLATVY